MGLRWISQGDFYFQMKNNIWEPYVIINSTKTEHTDIEAIIF